MSSLSSVAPRRDGGHGQIIRIFAREVLRCLERASGVRGAKAGGVSFPQRFGGSLNLNTHVHAVFPDGVFVRGSASVRAEFLRAAPPTPPVLIALCERIHERFVRWLSGRGLLRADEHESNDRPESSCIDSCTETALGIGTLGKVDDGPELKRGAPALFAPATASDVTPKKPAPIPAPKSWWIDWATLLWRVYDVDALQWPCGGRLRFVEVVDDPKAAAVVLRALGLPAEPPDVARARDPTPDADASPPDTHVDVTHPDDLDPPPPASW